MIEDQVSPKRCGHTRGKQVVPRGEANMRVRAALDERSANGLEHDILDMARTDARAVHGFDEAWIAAACLRTKVLILFFWKRRNPARKWRYSAASYHAPVRPLGWVAVPLPSYRRRKGGGLQARGVSAGADGQRGTRDAAGTRCARAWRNAGGCKFRGYQEWWASPVTTNWSSATVAKIDRLA